MRVSVLLQNLATPVKVVVIVLFHLVFALTQYTGKSYTPSQTNQREDRRKTGAVPSSQRRETRKLPRAAIPLHMGP
jgi:hypothetical protein